MFPVTVRKHIWHRFRCDLPRLSDAAWSPPADGRWLPVERNRTADAHRRAGNAAPHEVTTPKWVSVHRFFRHGLTIYRSRHAARLSSRILPTARLSDATLHSANPGWYSGR